MSTRISEFVGMDRPMEKLIDHLVGDHNAAQNALLFSREGG
jgi:hypothetical protein